MNLIRLFTREELIAGLEINDEYLRLALLEKTDSGTKINFLIEEPLSKDIIVNGLIKKHDEFVQALKALVKKAEFKVRYVIVSIPADNCYSKIFSFPKTLSKEKLETAMELKVGFQLPVETADVYLDWEKIERDEPDKKEILLLTIPKEIIDSYTKDLNRAGLKAVAIETHPLSFSRTLDVPPDKITLVTAEGRTSFGTFIIKHKILHFSRVVPKTRLEKVEVSPVKDHSVPLEIPQGNVSDNKLQNKQENSGSLTGPAGDGATRSDSSETKRVSTLERSVSDGIKEEIRKVTNFYETEDGPIAQTIELKKAKIVKEFSLHSETKEGGGEWLTSLGAAVRGILPRSEDTLISLMPISTSEAYEYQKAVVFSEFISGLTAGFALLFAAIFTGMWFFVVSIQQKTLSQLEFLSSLPIPADAAEIEEETDKINQLVGITDEITKSIPRWSLIFEELESKTSEGIKLTRLSFPSPEEKITITGVAQDRDQLNAFKEDLEKSDLFAGIDLPPTHLEKKTNIPFSMSFRLGDPGKIYYDN